MYPTAKFVYLAVLFVSSLSIVSAIQWNVTVGVNATSTFDPVLVEGNPGDTIVFTC